MRRLNVCLCVLALATLFAADLSHSAQKGTAPRPDESLRRGETRATLDPGMFSEPYVKKAYQIAKEIPWVLDSIYCYCKCEESPVFRHKSLLTCYVDNHAAV